MTRYCDGARTVVQDDRKNREPAHPVKLRHMRTDATALGMRETDLDRSARNRVRGVSN